MYFIEHLKQGFGRPAWRAVEPFSAAQTGIRYAPGLNATLRSMKASLLPALLLFASELAAAGSECHGRVADGRLEGGVQLPKSGANFSAYSSIGVTLGRTYVHSTVRDIVVAAYAALGKSAAQKKFIYGETGWERGGRMEPHRTHQNGSSVDFMVPVLDPGGRSVPVPTGVLQKFGYSLEFDDEGRYDDYQIDFEAIGEHLYQLQAAAAAQGAGLALVIFDPRYLPKLFATARGAQLGASLKFMPRDAWVRHDEHYHVDFDIACKGADKS